MIRCLNCMEEYGESQSTCPFCGAWKNVEQPDKEYLRSGTVLDGRYIIGIADKRTESYVCYAAWDISAEKKRTALEFFPKNLAVRLHNSDSLIPAPEKTATAFDKALAEFAVNRSFDWTEKIKANNTVYLICEKAPADPKAMKKISLPAAVLLCFAAVAAVTILVLAISGMLKSDRRNFAPVPELTGMILSDALEAAAAADFNIEVTGRIYGSDTSENTVLSQSETAGKLADTKKRIGVVIGGGSGYAVMPDFLYLSADSLNLNENYLKLKEAGIEILIDRQDSVSGLPVLITAQDPGPGTVLRSGDKVTLMSASDGTAAEIVKLSQTSCPDIRGKTYAEAKASLKAKGFAAVCAYYIYSKDPAGTVSSQVPAAGEKAYAGSAIFIALNAGLRKNAVPNLYGIDEDEALLLLNEVCYNVKYEYDSSDDTAEGCVYDQDSKAGSVLSEGDTLVLYVRSDTGKPPVFIEYKTADDDAAYSMKSPGSKHMNIGDSIAYDIPLLDAEGSRTDDSVIETGIWVSSDSSVVSITKDRKLNAVSEGISVVGVYCGGTQTQFPVVVTDPENYIKVSLADAKQGKNLEKTLKDADIDFEVVLMKGEAETGQVLDISGTVYSDAEYYYIKKDVPVTVYESRGNKENYYRIKDFTVLSMTEREVSAMLDIAGVKEYSYSYERSDFKEGSVYRAVFKGFEENGYLYVMADTPVELFVSMGK